MSVFLHLYFSRGAVVAGVVHMAAAVHMFHSFHFVSRFNDTTTSAALLRSSSTSTSSSSSGNDEGPRAHQPDRFHFIARRAFELLLLSWASLDETLKSPDERERDREIINGSREKCAKPTVLPQ